MNYMYTICTNKEIGKIRTFILKIMGVSFVNNFRVK